MVVDMSGTPKSIPSGFPGQNTANMPRIDSTSQKPIPITVEVPDDAPPANRPSRTTQPRGRRPRVRADETLVRKTLFTMFGTTSFAFQLTGYGKYQLTTNEQGQLADVWTQVIMDYPDLLKWFDQGGKLTNVASAIIITVSIFFPKFTGIDLNKPVVFSGNGRSNNSYDFGANPTNGTAESSANQTGPARFDGRDNWLRQDHPSSIIADG